MKSLPVNQMVKRAAVARFLEQGHEEIERMIEEDGLPVVRLPGKAKPSIRIFLPAFHRWLMTYAGGDPDLADYETFKRAFAEAQESTRAA